MEDKIVCTVKKLVGINTCFSNYTIDCEFCPGDKTKGGTPPEYWNCNKESESAIKWLKEHNIPFEEVKE